MPGNYHKQRIALFFILLLPHIPTIGCNPQDNTQQTEYSKEDGTTVWEGRKTSRSENSRLASGKAVHAYKSKFATNLLSLGFLEGDGGLFVSSHTLSPTSLSRPCQRLGRAQELQLMGRTWRVTIQKQKHLHQDGRATSVLINARALILIFKTTVMAVVTPPPHTRTSSPPPTSSSRKPQFSISEVRKGQGGKKPLPA